MNDDRILKMALWGAANTANAHRPLRPGPLCVPSFFASWMTTELPLHALGLQSVVAAGAVGRGALRTSKGRAAAAITAASWAGLWSLYKENQRSHEVLEAALVDGLGRDYREEIHDGIDLVPDDETRLQHLAVPYPATALKKWGHAFDVPYGEAGKRNLLDIWKRPDLPDDANAPVLFQIHGGAWMIGEKQQQAFPLMSWLARQGWICVSINYPLSPKATWPDHIVEAKRALAWIKNNIADYGGDPGFVAVTGGSAGGHLSALVGMSQNHGPFQPGFEDADTSVQACVPFYGIYDWTDRDRTGRADMVEMLERLVVKRPKRGNEEIYDEASPIHHVSPEAPPTMVLHGSRDVLTFVEQARHFVAHLRSVSNQPVVYAELPGAQHAFDIFNSPRARHTARAVHRFLAHQHTRYLEQAERASDATTSAADANGAAEADAPATADSAG